MPRRSTLPWPRTLRGHVDAMLPDGGRRRVDMGDTLVAAVRAGIAELVRGLEDTAIIELVYDRLGHALGLGPVFGAPPPAPPVLDDTTFADDFAAWVRGLSRAEIVRLAEPFLRQHVLGETAAEAPSNATVELDEARAALTLARSTSAAWKALAKVLRADGLDLWAERDGARLAAAVLRDEALESAEREGRFAGLLLRAHEVDDARWREARVRNTAIRALVDELVAQRDAARNERGAALLDAYRVGEALAVAEARVLALVVGDFEPLAMISPSTG